MTESNEEPHRERFALDMSGEEFRVAGHELIDLLADFFDGLPERAVTSGDSVDETRAAFPPTDLPEHGVPAAGLIRHVAPLLFNHSIHNGHPRFFAYITSSAAPLGALADLLASAINQNCALRDLSPAANEIERQTIDWLAALIGFPRPCGGIMVSGGNMANMLGFLAARHARLPWPVRHEGLAANRARPVVYASHGTHTWLEKTADVTGLGTDAIRLVATDRDHRLEPDDLARQIVADRAEGLLPFFVVGTAGNVSTGALDPLPEIAAIAEREGLWFHIDGAYGAPAATLPDAPPEFAALARADSVALDPHKWLYNPIEAACVLVRDPRALANALSYKPSYYRFEGGSTEAGNGTVETSPREPAAVNYYEHGLQNTRGFRALKTWLCLQQAGRRGYAERIGRDIEHARRLYGRACSEPELEGGTRHLSIATFRYRPPDVDDNDYLDVVNSRIVERLRGGGETFLSNAVLDGQQFLRACIVNFRTEAEDVDALIEAVLRTGREVHAELKSRSPI